MRPILLGLTVALASGCYASHRQSGSDEAPRDASGGLADGGSLDAGRSERDAGRIRMDAGIREIPPEAGPPDGGELIACHPGTIFVSIDSPGCVSREIPGGNGALCDAAGSGSFAGQPVTVINNAGKSARIEYVYLGSDGCDSHPCAIGTGFHELHTCTCDGAGTYLDGPLAGPETLIIEYLASASSRSFVLGDELSRWRVIACTIDGP